MARKKQPSRPSELSRLAREILLSIRDDFVSKGLPTAALTSGREGPLTKDLELAVCTSGNSSKVDFELAVAELENGQLIRTGPWVPFDNKPGSDVIILSMYSKREYVCLTEAGYRAAGTLKEGKPRSPSSRIHISGGSFTNAQIAAGHEVTQMQRVDAEADAATRLRKLLEDEGISIRDETEKDLRLVVSSAERGNAGRLSQSLSGCSASARKRQSKSDGALSSVW
jgi:hypothetical protein